MVLLFLNNIKSGQNTRNTKYNIQITQTQNTNKNTKLGLMYFSSKIQYQFTKHEKVQNQVPGTCHPSTSSLPRAFYFHGKQSQHVKEIYSFDMVHLSMTWHTPNRHVKTICFFGHGTIVNDMAHLTFAPQTHSMALPCLVKMSCNNYFCYYTYFKKSPVRPSKQRGNFFW